MKRIQESYEVVVCGGGLAGFCAAVAAARHGASTCLVHNRPVFGGNSSSEIGVTPHGAAAFHAYARETGIISEALIEERAQNHAEVYENGWTNSVWDMVLYDLAAKTPNLTLHLNTNVTGVLLADGTRGEPDAAGDADLSLGYYHRPAKHAGEVRLKAVVAEVQNAEVELTLRGNVFIDCTGDALVGDRAGCEWRMGTESRAEFDEPHAPPSASTDTMGSSIHFRCVNLGRPTPYRAPDWAVKHEDASFFYDQGRLPKEERGGYWWIEIGVPYHTIHDNEDIRHELTRHTLGVWDWMKNRDPVMKERARNYALDWIGQVPGKRESRRLIGKYFVTEHDIQNRTVFQDEVAFGGWFIDLHTPGGLLAESSEPSSTGEQEYDTLSDYAVKSYCGPYGVPLRCLMSKDVPNLMMAGRNISSTHAALGTLRVMGTTALLGQACGVAAAYGVKHGLGFDELVTGKPIKEIQQTLLRDGCFLLNARNGDSSDLARRAHVACSSTAAVTGVGPDTPSVQDGLATWRDQPQYDLRSLEVRRGQLIAIGDEGVDEVAVLLSNSGASTEHIGARLCAVDGLWDYRVEAGPALAETTLSVKPGEGQWVTWRLPHRIGADRRSGSYVRLDLLPNPKVGWIEAACVLPGHVASYQISPDKMRRFSNGSTMSFRVAPAQRCYPAEMVLSGATRPHHATNLWRSAPMSGDPEWIELRWDQPIEVSRVELTFPGHLLREYHAYAPFYRDCQCVSDYEIEIPDGEGWRPVVVVEGNYQRRRVHPLESPAETDRLRIKVLATNGDPSAAVYEIRCY